MTSPNSVRYWDVINIERETAERVATCDTKVAAVEAAKTATAMTSERHTASMVIGPRHHQLNRQRARS